MRQINNTHKATRSYARSQGLANDGYEIVDTKTDNVAKTGVSGGQLNQNGSSRRANSQANRWNKELGNEGRYVPRVVKQVRYQQDKVLEKKY
ncbi:hypothetical protein [Marinomonas sp. 2405UD68-3]|uniref:hypothetical protein n=1 Tax=Marinomonas sp. 2405UD68-3 TaxID=3391835 RepID=UPI0039C9573C